MASKRVQKKVRSARPGDSRVQLELGNDFQVVPTRRGGAGGPVDDARPLAARWQLADGEFVAGGAMHRLHGGGQIETVAGFDTKHAAVGALTSGANHIGARLVPGDGADGLDRVIGTADTRVRLDSTSNLPWRCICHIHVRRASGESIHATGWLAGPRICVTAGHVLLPENSTDAPSEIDIWAGQDGAEFQSHSTGSRFWVHPGWQATRSRAFDVGVVTLADDQMAVRLGWFGRAVFSDERFRDMLVNTAGYPLDKRAQTSPPIWTQWFDADRIRRTDEHFLYYAIDTDAGQSGAPVFFKDGDVRSVVGIHVGFDGGLNRAVRMTQPLFDAIGHFQHGTG